MSELPTEEQIADRVTRLADLLSAAMKAAPPSFDPAYTLAFATMQLRDSPETAIPAMRSLLGGLENALGPLTSAKQIGAGPTLSVADTVRNLIVAARRASPERALNGLIHLAAGKEVALQTTIAFDGPVPESPVQFADFTCTRFGPVSESMGTRWAVAHSALHAGGIPSTLLVDESRKAKGWTYPWEPEDPNRALDEVRVLRSLDICLQALLVSSRQPLQQRYWWTEPADPAIPWNLSVCTVVGAVHPMPPQSSHSIGTVREWETTYGLASTRTEKDLEELRVPIENLRISLQLTNGFDLARAAVHLGTALEALFVPEGKTSSTPVQAICSRAAGYLTASTTGPKFGGVRTAVTEAYDLRSVAVHSGRIEGDLMATRRVLAVGQEVVADGLVRMLREGIPDLTKYFRTTKNGG